MIFERSGLPEYTHGLQEFEHRMILISIRTNIKWLAVNIYFLFREDLCGAQVAAQWFQYVLPGPGGIWIPDLNRLCLIPGTETVRHDPVERPVPAPDYIARPDRSQPDFGFRFTKIRMKISFDYEFRRALGSAVRILAAQCILLPVSPDPFHVVVTLITGDDHGMAWFGNRSQCLQYIGRTHGIGLKGIQGILIRNRNDGLGSQVKNKIRLHTRKYFFHLRRITDILKMMLRFFGQFQFLKQRWIRRDVLRNTDHIGTQAIEPKAEPGSFETGISSYNYFFIFKNVVEHIH